MRPIQSVAFSLVLVAGMRGLPAQVPARVDYTLTVDSADLTGVTVEMRVQRAPASFRVAMAAHTEYDDRYWRYLTGLGGESSRGPVLVTREGNSIWQIDSPVGDVTLRYRVRFPESPPMQQASWMAHLTPTGGLIGGPHSFLYVLGGERSPVTVTVRAPAGWRIVTGLRTSGGPGTFEASGAETLIDSPMLVGAVQSWHFEIDRRPHQIAYLGRAAGTPFDTARFVSNVERIARATARMFGRMPYSRFSFMFEDGSYGGLEHVNSVSIGTQSANLARDVNGPLGQIAHEFFHTWNEVQLRPEAWIGLRPVAPEPTGELWWSEGVTLYYADLLLRRAGLPTIDSTRVARLERLIGNYIANSSHAAISAEETSRAFNKPDSVTGDYTPSMFLQGELLGTILDLMILDASNGRHSLDDAMRTLSSRFTIDRGFTGLDVEHAVAAVCACSVGPFFDSYIRAPGSLPFDRWLAVIGLQMSVSWAPALSSDGSLAPDLRVGAIPVERDSAVALKIWFPATALAQAGFHTGDRVESLNGVPIHDLALFRSTLGQLRIGDTLRIIARRTSALIDKTITIAGYDRPRVRITPLPNASPAQRALFARWIEGR